MRYVLSFVLAAGLLGGCEKSEPPATPAPEPAAVTAPEAPAVPEPIADQNEACVQGIIVSHTEASVVPDGVTRTKDEARLRAEGLRERATTGANFPELAQAESDGRSTAPRGGVLGTFTRAEWPALHGALKDPVFVLPVGSVTEVIDAPYGFVVARRCPVEKVHTRHILIRYQGARNAGDDITRSKDEARALAEQLHGAVQMNGVDFAEIARARSEDSSAERGGDIGAIGRGLLELPYEQAAFAVEEGQFATEVVETRVGFHVIQRLPL